MSKVIEEADWNPKPILRPGMDFHEDMAYFTIPLGRTSRKPGKGKDAEPTFVKEPATYVVTSDHHGFWYDEKDLELAGFLPSEQVYQERTPNWSLESAKAYLDGKAPTVLTKALFSEMRTVYTTYVEYADDIAYDLMALFVMYTYVFRLFESTGYVHFNGTAASGKSRNLAILDVLAFNAVWASSMSAASLYRKLAGSPGTTCIDESEGFDGERGEELRRILNAGYKDGATAIRTEKTKNDRYMPVEYEVFGPKALASINPLEPVIASRCVVIPMRPAIRQLPDFTRRNPRWQELRDHLYVWALDNASALAALTAEWHSESGKKQRLAPKLISRQWETTAQFVVLADYVGGEEFATKVIEWFNGYFVKQQKAADASDRLRTTLRALPRVLASKQAYPGNMYSLKDIHEVISGYLEEDQREYFKTKHVGKNLDTIGFRNKARATGGMRVELNEDAVRAEFTQRQVEVMDEDTEWFEGKRSYQNLTTEADDDDPKWWDRDNGDEPA
jgi:hypothetical protein